MKELFSALSKFQGECPTIEKNKKGAWGMYADLAGIMEKVRVPLAKNGLSVIQTISSQDEFYVLTTTLAHASGEQMTSSIKMEFAGKNVQQLGAAISYYRRYALSCVLGVVADVDVDDVSKDNDCNHHFEKKEVAPKPSNNSFVTAAQKGLIHALVDQLKGHFDIKTIYDHYKIESLDTLPISEASKVIDSLKKKKLSYVKDLMKQKGVEETDFCEQYGVLSIDHMQDTDLTKVLKSLREA